MPFRSFAGELREVMRYGENPHQWAAFYATGDKRPGVATATQVQGKSLSYNNLNDTDAAFELISEFDPATPAVAIIKHANPCGVATGPDLAHRLPARLRHRHRPRPSAASSPSTARSTPRSRPRS